MRRFVALAALIWLPFAFEAVGAEELRYGFDASTTWTDDVFFTTGAGEISDSSVRLTPKLGLTDRSGQLTWQAEYKPSYEYWVDTRGLRGWDHDFGGALAWQITRRTTLRIQNDFERFRSLHRLNEREGVDTTAEGLGLRQRFVRNRVAASLTHQLSKRQAVSANVSHLLWDFSEEVRSDIEVVTAGVAYSYLWSPRTRVGVGASWRNRSNENEALNTESNTDFYSLDFTIDYAFDPTWSLSATAGPAWVAGGSGFDPPSDATVARFPTLGVGGQLFFVDSSTCPTLPDGRPFLSTRCSPIGPALGNLFTPSSVDVPFAGSVLRGGDGSLAAFLDITLTKDFPAGSFELSVRRQEDHSAQSVSSGVANVVRATAEWKPSPKWRFFAVAIYQLREQETDQPVLQVAVSPAATPPCTDLFLLGVCLSGTTVLGAAEATSVGARELRNDDDITTMRAWIGVHYRLNRRTSLRARLYWADEKRERSVFRTTEGDRFSVWLGVQYDFEPVEL